MIKQIRRIIKLAGKYKTRIRLAYLFSLLRALCSYGPYTLAVYIIKLLYENKMTMEKLGTMIAIIAAMFVGQVLFSYMSDRLQSTAGYLLFSDLRIKLGEKLRHMPMGFFTDGNIGKISTVLAVDMGFIETNCMNTISSFVGDICSEILIISFMTFLHPLLGALTLFMSLVIVLIGNISMRHEQAEADGKQALNEELSSHVLEYIEGMGVIKSYNMVDSESTDIENAFEKMKDECIAFEKKVTPSLRIMEFANAVGILLLISLCIRLFSVGEIERFRALAVCIFSFGVFRPIKEVYLQVTRFAVMNSSLNRMEEIFDLDVLDEKDIATIPERAPVGVPEIEFKDVSFAYEKESVLKNVSFKVEKNTMAALVGPSGGGKSTVASLLTRFWDVNSGKVMIRGVDIKDVPMENLMDNISVVFQKVYLFKDSIYNNIRMGRPDATREEILECARKARCMDFIDKLPYGIDTVIGEGGASLSGGEAQRISIARCILKDSPIVILDEATASVDADNEAYIQEAIDELCSGKTLLVIAHRLNTIENADVVYKVENKTVA
ncbi:ABC transporter ATP-binding protein [Butyrivibrio sp. XB500-5]|uniref:ABC transporter ATP-binding protein n=1 Tax=Butyrivibrio sp. XB500-5 TaxID=2364880 RepID=UPI000EA9A0DE|nr:ABC transporter ATP-binding protein [Butyrivibrio sp. XB500-5]RKM57644.1 ABC transporter ATP-binding protein [Butyrivibrio sp. XB500-5]